MKLRNKLYPLALGALLVAGATTSCSLDEEVLGRKTVDTGSGGGSTSDLAGVYNQLNEFGNQSNMYALQEHTSDEMQGPTRGTDWGDFGTWRKLHQHTWDAQHNQINDTWDIMNIGVFRATQVIAKSTDNQSKAEASFLRAFFMFNLVDFFGQVPFRETTDSPDANPKVFSRKEALDFVVKDLEFAASTLTSGTAGKATKEAANFLLAKVLLNKAVYTQDSKTPSGPFTFVKADMDNVVKYADVVINSGKYSIEPAKEYFDNFKWDNTTASKELIFVRENNNTEQPGNVRNRSYMTLHYSQKPSGWNGFTTLADFYNGFEKGDVRLGGPLTGFTDKTGLNAGFLIGQQKDEKGVNLKDRSGNPLAFSTDVNLLFASETKGVRVIKFPLDPANIDNSANDYVFFRYADVILMKAEALLRGGNAAGALTLVNQIRTNRGLVALTALTEKALLEERGHELYWEGWRRNDQVRFGTFLNPMDNKASTSPNHVVVFPIPQRAVDTNPNLKQNFGY